MAARPSGRRRTTLPPRLSAVKLDVLEAGGDGWFFRDHRAGSYEGTAAGPEPELPTAFFRALVAVRAHVEAAGLREG